MLQLEEQGFPHLPCMTSPLRICRFIVFSPPLHLEWSPTVSLLWQTPRLCVSEMVAKGFCNFSSAGQFLQMCRYSPQPCLLVIIIRLQFQEQLFALAGSVKLDCFKIHSSHKWKVSMTFYMLQKENTRRSMFVTCSHWFKSQPVSKLVLDLGALHSFSLYTENKHALSISELHFWTHVFTQPCHDKDLYIEHPFSFSSSLSLSIPVLWVAVLHFVEGSLRVWDGESQSCQTTFFSR